MKDLAARHTRPTTGQWAGTPSAPPPPQPRAAAQVPPQGLAGGGTSTVTSVRPPAEDPYAWPGETAGMGPYGPPDGGAPPPTSGGWTVRRRLAAAVAVLALALGSGATGAAVTMMASEPQTVASSPTVVSGAGGTSGSSVAAVAAAVKPSVVSITAVSGPNQSTGSGVILSSDGTIMTNAHVVSGASGLTVKFSDGATAQASLVGADTSADIAVIKAAGVSGLVPATLGDSDDLTVGDSVLAVGSPLGLAGSVTSGIVSALDREISESGDERPNAPYGSGGSSGQGAVTIDHAIQTDAAINPGNSGGALVDASGHVIGITTAIATTSSDSGNIGVGFAIPVNDAKTVADRLVAAS